jgi:hypothetical protein
MVSCKMLTNNIRLLLRKLADRYNTMNECEFGNGVVGNGVVGNGVVGKREEINY